MKLENEQFKEWHSSKMFGNHMVANMEEAFEAGQRTLPPEVTALIEAATEYSRAFYRGNGKRQSNARMTLLEAVDNYYGGMVNVPFDKEKDNDRLP